MKQRKDFVPIRDIMKTVLRTMQQHQSTQRQKVAQLWNEMVGEEFADCTTVCKVTRTEVIIEVCSSAVLAELKQFYQAPFLKRLRSHGISGIEKVLFKIAD